jgi:DnaJ-domain-containing protein 1
MSWFGRRRVREPYNPAASSRGVKNQRLVLALAAVFAGMTVLMVVLAAAFRDPVPLFVALPFAAATYFFWYHATGRVATGIYERVERQARANSNANASTDGGRGGFGAGPREDWTPPGGADRWERVRGASRTARGGRRAYDGRGRTSAPNAGSGPSAAEARRVLGVEADADESAVRRAYRERAKETHPDTEGGDEDEFKRVNRAYERLTD